MGDHLFGSNLSDIYKQYMQGAMQQQQAAAYNAYNLGWSGTTVTATWSPEQDQMMKALQAPQKQARVKLDNEQWLDRRVNEMRVAL